MASDTLIVNHAVGKEFDVQCQHCVGSTAHRVLADAKKSGSDCHMSWETDYQILQCMGCRVMSFRSAASNSEDFHHYYDEDGDEQVEYALDEKLYPPRIAGFVALRDDVWVLPDKLRRIYQETTHALISDQPVLTGIGVRAILETLCKDKAAIGRNLFEQIDDLVRQKILTPVRANVLHQIRTLGNQAAHEVEPHTREQLGLAMAVLNHLLEEVYVLPEKAKRLFAPLAGSRPTALSAPLRTPALPPVVSIPMPPSFEQKERERTESKLM